MFKVNLYRHKLLRSYGFLCRPEKRDIESGVCFFCVWQMLLYAKQTDSKDDDDDNST